MTCGIWTTLELIINKESSELIWEKGDNWPKQVPKKEKKDKPKLGKIIPLIEDALKVGGLSGGSDSAISPLHSAIPTGRRMSTFKRRSEPKLQFKPNFSLKRSSVSEELAREQKEHKPLNLDYFESLIDCRLTTIQIIRNISVCYVLYYTFFLFCLMKWICGKSELSSWMCNNHSEFVNNVFFSFGFFRFYDESRFDNRHACPALGIF